MSEITGVNFAAYKALESECDRLKAEIADLKSLLGLLIAWLFQRD